MYRATFQVQRLNVGLCLAIAFRCAQPVGASSKAHHLQVCFRGNRRDDTLGAKATFDNGDGLGRILPWYSALLATAAVKPGVLQAGYVMRTCFLFLDRVPGINRS